MMGTAERPGAVGEQESGIGGHLELGRRGEELAAEHLRRSGLVLLSRNWRCREGELDLVGTDGHTLVVCEVKTRSGRGFGLPEEAVTEEKIVRIRRITGQWLSAHHVNWCPVRFDVIAVDWPRGGKPRLRHHKAAF